MTPDGQESPAQADDQVPRYRVAAVERVTNIPASTLRSWERRYGWPRPARAASGQRLYSDQDVAVIRFLNRRRVEGMSLSQAAGLLRSAPAVEDRDPGRLLARLVAAFRAFDEADAEAAFAAAEALLGVESVTIGLIPAAIVAASAHHPGQDGPPVEVEHFASNFLRGQTLRLLDGLPPAIGRPVLIGCGPDEQHELGALLLMVLLRARGHRVVYLGARVPGPAMERAAAALDPAGVVVSLTMPESLERALEWMGERRRWSRSTPAWWGGPAVANAPDLAARLPGGLLAGSVDQGAAALDATLARRR
ncbi:MAG: cobalamin-dependent protein [Actinomycetes bacterium]|jgi:DNA-binding transcriptional MerR regulator